MNILDVPVSVVDMTGAVSEIASWVDHRSGRYVCAADVNSIMQARRNQRHHEALAAADMIVPDGTPLVWTSQSRGERHMARVPGPDLMLELCAFGIDRGWRHFFYGGADGVAEDLANTLSARFPGLSIAGFDAPPFRPLTAVENLESIAEISAADPHILWLGLGCPKQEIWMKENASRLPRTVVIGVGAAFNFHSNRIRRAPLWMRRNGLEWLHRLGSEPQRLWRRYLLLGPQFLVLSSLETLRLRWSAAPATQLPDEGAR